MKLSSLQKSISAVALLIALFSQIIPQTKPLTISRAPVPLKTNIKKDKMVPRLEQLVPQLMKEGVVPGLSVLVIRDGKVFWEHEFGVKNAETKEAVDADTVFGAASLSKPVFAYAVLKLADSGRLDLDTPLVKYLPGAYVENDERLNQITARRVLTHTTGFPNWRQNNQLKINFTPGERFSYSGEGFVYLQKAVERLTGEPFDLFMRKMVFEPLGMTSSSYVWQERYESRRTFGHDAFGKVAGRRKPEEANAAATLQTTAQDYARFVIAVMNGTGLKKETARRMLTPQIRVQEGCQDCVTRPGTGKLSSTVSWGLGWGLQHTEDGDAFWHWGDNGSDAHAYVVAYPKQKVGLLIFTNSSNGQSIIPEIIEEAMGGRQPAIAWLNYESFNSPGKTLIRDIMSRGEAAINDYREQRKAPSFTGKLNEAQMNSLGYALLSQKKLGEAIEIFKMNVEDFPNSPNVYDSLGEAYMVRGDKDLAIKNYQKSIELNPKNENGIKMLRKLQDQ